MDTYISTFKRDLTSLGSDVLNINIDDNISFVDKFAPNNEKMEQIIDFVNKHQNKKFIINCKVGQSRSFTLSRLIESYIKNILEKPSEGCYIISPDIEYNYALICYFLLQVIYYLYNKKISAEKAIPKILNFIKFFPSDLTTKLEHFFNNIDDITISVLDMDDKLEAYTDKIYNSLNAYISNDRMGREGHVNPAFVIPNSFKVTAGKIFKTNIYDNIHMDATTFNNIINYSADICKNSKKISISSYDIIITMASSTKNFFGEFLKSLDSSISHSIIISYGDTYNILKTTSLSSQCPSNLSIIKTDNPPLKDKSQASKESKRVSSFNDVSLFEQLLKSLKRSKKKY